MSVARGLPLLVLTLVVATTPGVGRAARGSVDYSLEKLERFYLVVESDVDGVSEDVLRRALELEVRKPIVGAPRNQRLALVDERDYRSALKTGTPDVARLRLVVVPVEGADVLAWTLHVEQAVSLMRSQTMRPFVTTTWATQRFAPVRERGAVLVSLVEAFRNAWWEVNHPRSE